VLQCQNACKLNTLLYKKNAFNYLKAFFWFNEVWLLLFALKDLCIMRVSFLIFFYSISYIVLNKSLLQSIKSSGFEMFSIYEVNNSEDKASLVFESKSLSIVEK